MTDPADVSSIPDAELLRRAVVNARSRYVVTEKPHWHHVQRTFALGSTYAAQLCRRFGVDPEAIVPSDDDETESANVTVKFPELLRLFQDYQSACTRAVTRGEWCKFETAKRDLFAGLAVIGIFVEGTDDD